MLASWWKQDLNPGRASGIYRESPGCSEGLVTPGLQVAGRAVL